MQLSTTPDSLYSSHPGDISGETFTLELFRTGPRVSTAADLQGECTLQNVEAEVKCLSATGISLARGANLEIIRGRLANTASCSDLLRRPEQSFPGTYAARGHPHWPLHFFRSEGRRL